MTLPVLDEAHIAELLELMEEEFHSLSDNFFVHANEMLSKLSRMDESDQEKFVLTIHSLKGSSRNMGGENLSELCESIEKMARNSQFSEAQEKLPLVGRELDRLKLAIDVHLGDLGIK